MSTKTVIITGVTVSMLLILFVKIYYDSTDPGGALLERNTAAADRINAVNKGFLEQRNNLSRILNRKQQRLGQMECEKAVNQATSETGGWCQKASTEGSGQHMTDTKLASALADFFKGKYVGSFGDGPGRYKQLLTDSGKLKAYDAYDGAPFCDVTSEGRVQFLDLTLPQYGLPLYDWIISLEVAEHIPEQFESTFIDNIVRHAREGVVLSWARPGQGGYSHVNNRPFEYVKELMERLGFSHDDLESEKLKNIASFPWFKWNTNVYRRKRSSLSEDLNYFT
ncbi:uncharacterized protein LOC132750721 [Ruditapes philippinarum]|uniref:uncharacterized protein LOC132750721 n=1 Tax=Ruditapes philippinarum TaxID=129788 RepID=UPI00295A62C8|nr:uncharacterized protein LOC132750721 [Ruditapes philippinarum]